VLASLPSPPDNAIHLGPLQLRAYGLMIALGVFAAVWLAQRRWVRRGGSPEDMSAIAVWAVPAGLIGARVYHVITDWQRFEGRWGDAVKIWEGGLGIPGGMFAGVLVGAWAARRRGLRVGDAVDAAAPALPLAQAIGRLGNWFNQELFGGPTSLPWGLEIDPEHRPLRYANEPTFHPTFLYEALWNLGLMAVLLLVDRLGWVRRGRLIALYVAGYGVGRLWVEAMRVDPASEVLGLRVNIWISLIAITGGVLGLLVGRRAGADSDERADDAGESDAGEIDGSDTDHASDAGEIDAGESDAGELSEGSGSTSTPEPRPHG
jgi:prolipoprotein diacylglyceryl transferase